MLCPVASVKKIKFVKDKIMTLRKYEMNMSNLFNSSLKEESRGVLQAVQRKTRRTHMEAVWNAERNFEIDAKLANSHRAASVAFHQTKLICTSTESIICIVRSCLQLTELSNSSMTVRGDSP